MSRTESQWEEIDGSYVKTTYPEGRNVLVNGLSKYLNFNTLSGTSGYGFRDNNGTMEVKNSGGSWSQIASVGSLSSYVPYTGANANLNLGAYTLTTSSIGYMSAKRTGALLVNLPSGFDDSNLSSDGTNISTNGIVSIGTSAITAKFNLLSITEQARISYDVNNYYSTTVGSTGIVTYLATGSGATFKFSNGVSLVSTTPNLLLEGGTNAVNAGTLTFRTTSGSESFTQTFNASDNNFYFKYGATTIGSLTSTGWGFGVTAFDNSATVHIINTTEQFRVGYDASNYYSTTVGSTGITTFDAFGASARFVFNDVVLVDYIWSVAGANVIDVSVNQLLNNGSVTVDWANKQLLDTSTVIASWASTGFTAPTLLTDTIKSYTGGTNAIGVQSRQLIAGDGSTLMADWSSGVFSMPSGMQSNNNYAYFTSSGGTYYGYLMNGYAGSFNDGNSNSFTFCDNTYASKSVGSVYMQGLASGAGAPATILTSYILYVDTATGLVYVQ